MLEWRPIGLPTNHREPLSRLIFRPPTSFKYATVVSPPGGPRIASSAAASHSLPGDSIFTRFSGSDGEDANFGTASNVALPISSDGPVWPDAASMNLRDREISIFYRLPVRDGFASPESGGPGPTKQLSVRPHCDSTAPPRIHHLFRRDVAQSQASQELTNRRLSSGCQRASEVPVQWPAGLPASNIPMDRTTEWRHLNTNCFATSQPQRSARRAANASLLSTGNDLE